MTYAIGDEIRFTWHDAIRTGRIETRFFDGVALIRVHVALTDGVFYGPSGRAYSGLSVPAELIIGRNPS